MNFRCPDDMKAHCAEVLVGCYAPNPVPNMKPEVILDIGACIGAYAVWAHAMWPGATIRCYEPNPAALEMLRMNVERFAGVYPVSVGAFAGRRRLYSGRNNLGEASLCDIGEQTEDFIEVDGIKAVSLPECDIMKVDTEGCEVEIILPYLTHHRPRIISFEYHSESAHLVLSDALRADYYLSTGFAHQCDRGVCNYVRR